jgi:hypothetical protein
MSIMVVNNLGESNQYGRHELQPCSVFSLCVLHGEDGSYRLQQLHLHDHCFHSTSLDLYYRETPFVCLIIELMKLQQVGKRNAMHPSQFLSDSSACV